MFSLTELVLSSQGCGSLLEISVWVLFGEDPVYTPKFCGRLYYDVDLLSADGSVREWWPLKIHPKEADTEYDYGEVQISITKQVIELPPEPVVLPVEPESDKKSKKSKSHTRSPSVGAGTASVPPPATAQVADGGTPSSSATTTAAVAVSVSAPALPTTGDDASVSTPRSSKKSKGFSSLFSRKKK